MNDIKKSKTFALLKRTALIGVLVCIVQFLLMQLSVPLFTTNSDNPILASARFMVFWFGVDFLIVLIWSLVCKTRKTNMVYLHATRFGIYVLAGIILIWQLFGDCGIIQDFPSIEIVATTFAVYIALDTAVGILMEKLLTSDAEPR